MLSILKSRDLVKQSKLDRDLDEIKINQGRILAELNARKPALSLNDCEFKVFSQWGEDGIIQFLTANVAIKHRTFIEFGVEDFRESNCRFLMMKDDWSGLVLDGSSKKINRLRSSYYYWRHALQSQVAFITRENIKALLDESGFAKELGILSVDIDGVDYYVLAELGDWKASILIVEYNALFGCRRAVSVPYSADFQRTRQHHSNLYYGASLPALAHIANQQGYAFVGANNAGCNAFFVRRELLNGAVREVSVIDGFRESRFRQARNERGELTYASPDEERKLIANMPLADVVSGETLTVADLND